MKKREPRITIAAQAVMVREQRLNRKRRPRQLVKVAGGVARGHLGRRRLVMTVRGAGDIRGVIPSAE